MNLRRRPPQAHARDAQPLLASGYAEGDAGLRGLADIVTFDVGKGHSGTTASGERGIRTVAASALRPPATPWG